MDKKNQDCPIRRQFIPRDEELRILPDEFKDPIGDSICSPVSGIVHRHKNRCLLFPTFTCSAYCRFCFRRELTASPQGINLTEPLAYIKQHTELREVILSGGDPLVLSDYYLGNLFRDLSDIEHIKVLRIHTRVFVSLPMRVTAQLVKIFKFFPRQKVVAIHVNHPKEITPQFISAVEKMKKADVMLLSQSVLLRGVNDSVPVLKELFEKLTDIGVKPYYIHQADMAQGTAHFRTSVEEGKKLMAELRLVLSGISMPMYMQDSPEATGKILLS
jgi:lysine 2,3-aminomutase